MNDTSTDRFYRVRLITPSVLPGSGTLNNGGVWVGASPPSDPVAGWLWWDANGHLFIYDNPPGLWVQIGTNW